MASSRFMVAVHTLSLLAEQGKAVSSDRIAGSVNTNPVVIRRVLGLLAKAGLVVSAEGARGGTTLARSAAKISLADVFRATEAEAERFGTPRNAPNPRCAVGRSVHRVMEKHVRRFERAMSREMAQVSIADVLTDIHVAGRR